MCRLGFVIIKFCVKYTFHQGDDSFIKHCCFCALCLVISLPLPLPMFSWIYQCDKCLLPTPLACGGSQLICQNLLAMGVVSICKVAANSQEACGCPQAPNINIATWLLMIQYQKILTFYHYLSFGLHCAKRARMTWHVISSAKTGGSDWVLNQGAIFTVSIVISGLF